MAFWEGSFSVDFFPFLVVFCPSPQTQPLTRETYSHFLCFRKPACLCFHPQVPSKKNVKVRFNMFFVLEPGIPVSSCPKDYVQINNTR